MDVTGRYLGMTIPVVSIIRLMQDGSTFEKDVVTAYFLPTEFQANPPEPTDPEVSISFRPPFAVLARSVLHKAQRWEVRSSQRFIAAAAADNIILLLALH